MPRAQAVFAAQGLTVDAWPVHDPHPMLRYRYPVLLHEVGGLLAYRLAGRL
jgi:hypothetical protein